jgi:hypothetical protein
MPEVYALSTQTQWNFDGPLGTIIHSASNLRLETLIEEVRASVRLSGVLGCWAVGRAAAGFIFDPDSKAKGQALPGTVILK